MVKRNLSQKWLNSDIVSVNLFGKGMLSLSCAELRKLKTASTGSIVAEDYSSPMRTT